MPETHRRSRACSMHVGWVILLTLFLAMANQSEIAARSASESESSGGIERRWSTPDCSDLGGARFLAGHIICAGDSGIRAYDSATGSRAWTYVEKTGGAKLPPVVSGSLLVRAADDHLMAIQYSSGQLAWSATSVKQEAFVDVEPSRYGTILFAHSTRSLYAFNSLTGHTLWHVGFASDIGGVLETLETVVVWCGDRVIVIDRQAGQVLWTLNLPQDVISAIDGNGSVFILTSAGLSSIDLRTGIERWRSAPPGSGRLVRVAMADGAILLQGSNLLSSIAPDYGTTIWKISLPQDFASLSVEGDIVKVVSATSVVIIRLHDGSSVWSQNLAAASFESIASMGLIFDWTQKTLTAIDLATGVEKWTSRLPVTTIDISVMQGIIVANESGRLERLDEKTGKVRWTAEIPSGDTQGNLAVTSTGAVVLMDMHQNLTMVDANTGNVFGSVPIGDPDPSARTVSIIGHDNAILLYQSSGRLIVFGAKPLVLEAGTKATVAEQITLRGAPNSRSLERGELSAGSVVELLDSDVDSSGTIWWHVVSSDGDEGWIQESALIPGAASEAATPVP